MANFHNTEIIVNGSKILAESATISETTDLLPGYSLGYRLPIDIALKGNIKNTFKIDYTVETNNEPNYNIVNDLINSTGQVFSPIQLIIGGITGNAYLESYNLEIAPNSIIKSSVSYFGFEELSGSFINQATSTSDNSLQSLGVAHYWTSKVTNEAQTVTGSVIQFNYGFKANWIPVFKIGRKQPSSVIFNNSQENYSLLMESPTHITYNPQRIGNSYLTVGGLVNNDTQYNGNYSLTGGNIYVNIINPLYSIEPYSLGWAIIDDFTSLIPFTSNTSSFLGAWSLFTSSGPDTPTVNIGGDFSSFNRLTISNISSLWSDLGVSNLTFHMFSGNIVSNEMSLREGNILTSAIEAIKYN